MTKKPDLSEISKKFDISGIVKSIKSMINPENTIPPIDSNDPIGARIAQINELVQQIAIMQEQQARDFIKVNMLLNGLYSDLQTLRNNPEKTVPEDN